MHPELARVAIDNPRLELSALTYSENGESTLLGNGAACPWLGALIILQGIPCYPAPPGWRPESTEPFRDLSVQEGCIGQALAEVLGIPPRKRNADESQSSWTDAKGKLAVLGLLLHSQVVEEEL